MPWMPPPKEKKKRINPIWGGIGFILIPIYLIGSYLLAEYLVVQNRAHGWFYVPNSITTLQQTLILAAAIGFFTFAIISLVWAIGHGPMGGPTDIHYSKHGRLKKRY
jgi:hypothetical protein